MLCPMRHLALLSAVVNQPTPIASPVISPRRVPHAARRAVALEDLAVLDVGVDGCKRRQGRLSEGDVVNHTGGELGALGPLVRVDEAELGVVEVLSTQLQEQRKENLGRDLFVHHVRL